MISGQFPIAFEKYAERKAFDLHTWLESAYPPSQALL
jgi:hypothetical protein